jgi:hypothetical protein
MPVVAEPELDALAGKPTPFGDPIRTLNAEVPVDVQVTVVAPYQFPPQTCIGFGAADMVPLDEVVVQPAVVVRTTTLARVLADVSGNPPDTSWR